MILSWARSPPMCARCLGVDQMTETFFCAGLDLGQSADYTALAILEVGREYHARHLQRFALGTPYPAIVSQVGAIMQAPALRGRCLLVVDATGVGAPVVDLLFAAGLPCVAITIHGGDAVTGAGNAWRVPKRDLVSILQVLLQTGRLKFAAELPEAPILIQELMAFRVTISDAGHDSYAAWREGAHDDLVLAVALALWYCERAPLQWEEVVSMRPVRIGPHF